MRDECIGADGLRLGFGDRAARNWQEEDAAHSARKGRELLVTRYILAPGALLNPLVKGREALIVGMNDGDVINEETRPEKHVNIAKGLVMWMPKKGPYRLRNVGKGSLDLLVVEMTK